MLNRFRNLWMLLICMGLTVYGYGQSSATQPPNPGFENWPGSETSSPAGWHSYDEASGIFASTVSNKSGGDQPSLQRVSGRFGKNAVVIRCNKVIGVAANGALTCGRVCMAAMGASSPKNYCFTDRANGYAYKFTARPDSVYFWAKFKMKGNVTASAKAHLHTDCDFRDFVDIGQPSDIASAIFYFQDKGNGQWHQYRQAFKAFASPQKATAEQAPIPTLNNWTRRPSYLLFSFTTNRYVMKGTKGDALYIDNIQFIYNKKLSMLYIDGMELPDFSGDLQDYVCFYDPKSSPLLPLVEASTESPRAEVSIRQATPTNPVAEVTVLHDDVIMGAASPKVYRILFLPRVSTSVALYNN